MSCSSFLQERLKTLRSQIYDEGSQLSSLSSVNCQLKLHGLKQLPCLLLFYGRKLAAMCFPGCPERLAHFWSISSIRTWERTDYLQRVGFKKGGIYLLAGNHSRRPEEWAGKGGGCTLWGNSPLQYCGGYLCCCSSFSFFFVFNLTCKEKVDCH